MSTSNGTEFAGASCVTPALKENTNMAMDYKPVFMQPPVAGYDMAKNYVAPAYYDDDFNQRLRSIPSASGFRKVDPVNQAGRIAIKYEGFMPKPYEDNSQMSIGYGTKALDTDTEITKAEALRRMEEDFRKRHQLMLNTYPAYRAMNPNTQGGVLDTAYNVGGFSKSPVMKQLLQNPANIPYIIQELPSYRKEDGVVNAGLERRRAEDVRLAIDPNDKEYFPSFVK
jgi:GH24 family phage-related lysozyme (muramidase)